MLIHYRACYIPLGKVYNRQGVFTSIHAYYAYIRAMNTITLGKWVYTDNWHDS